MDANRAHVELAQGVLRNFLRWFLHMYEFNVCVCVYVCVCYFLLISFKLSASFVVILCVALLCHLYLDVRRED